MEQGQAAWGESELLAALQGAQEKHLDLWLPRFKVAFKASLIGPFGQLGLKLAFDRDKADFSGMTGRPPDAPRLFISAIEHRAVLEVTEEGTEAAAATAVVMGGRGGRREPQPKPELFRVDRPFLFYIVDDATGAILFQGRIADPI